MLVIFIMDGTTRAGAITRFTDQWFELGIFGRDVQVAGVDLNAIIFDKVFISPRHFKGGTKHLPRLILRGGAAVNLGPIFPILGQHHQADRCGHRGLGVLFANEKQSPGEPSVPGFTADPSEYHGPVETLPVLKVDGLFPLGPFALDVVE